MWSLFHHMLKRQSVTTFCTAVALFLSGAICWAQRPELVVQTGHSDGVHSVTFAPDGRHGEQRSRPHDQALGDPYGPVVAHLYRTFR